MGLAKSTDAQEVLDFIHREIKCRHGTPAVLVCDNDVARGDVAAKCAGWGIFIKRIAPYAPYMNGLAEAMVKHYKKALRKLILQYGPDQWDQFVWDVAYLQRIIVRTTTRISAFELLYGRRPVLRVERMLANRYAYDPMGQEPKSEDAATPVEAALDDMWLYRRLNSLMRATRQKMLQDAASVQKDISQMQAITGFEKRQHRGVYRMQELKIDQMVIMRKHRKAHNLDPGWEGPYVFRGFYDEGAQVAILEDYAGTVWPRHITQIHPYRPSVRGQE